MKNSNVSIICVCIVMCLMNSAFGGTWRDDFEDDKTNEWEIFNLVRQHEKWWTTDGVAVGEIFEDPFLSLWRTGEIDWEYYKVSCRVKLVIDRIQAPTVGLTLHDRGDEGSRYLFLIDFESNIATISKEVPGGGALPGWYEVEKDTWYDISAQVYDDGNLDFLINDTLVVAAYDPEPLDGGLAGLVVQNAQAYFDNVEISGENIDDGGPTKSFAVEPQQKLTTTWGNLKRNGNL